MQKHLILFCLASCLSLPLVAGSDSGSDVPYAISFDECKVSISSIAFPKRVDGIDGNFVSPRESDKYRIAFVTIRIDKPAGRELTIAACDLTLHYRYGSAQEATICEGISQFSMGSEDERVMKLPKVNGPGFIKHTTGPKAAQAETVYVDAVFSGIEPNISEVWLCIAQPVSVSPFRTEGWTP